MARAALAPAVVHYDGGASENFIPSPKRWWCSFRRTAGALPLTLEKTTGEKVLIRVHAVSLNFRDIAMLDGRYPFPIQERGIPTSDCAAEVVAVGDAAAKEFGLAIGDHVAPPHMLHNLTGEEDIGTRGVLCEYAGSKGKHLASTLSCAVVTASLLQGTGGVSLCALLLCLAAGIHPIITSSSSDKLAKIRKLAPEAKSAGFRLGIFGWVRRKSARDGAGGINGKDATIKSGVAVGSKLDFQNLNKSLEDKDVKLAPAIDKVFAFDDSKAAFNYLSSEKAMGKVLSRFK
ncbi:alcohol dehydrogenase, partial [Mycena crocata]